MIAITITATMSQRMRAPISCPVMSMLLDAECSSITSLTSRRRPSPTVCRPGGRSS